MVKRSPQTIAVGVNASSGMASLVHLDNLDCASSAGATNEQITKLFPKCRPRDINLNPVVTHHPHHTPSSPFDDLSNDNTMIQDADADRCILKQQLKEDRELAQPETTTSASAPPPSADGAETLPFRQLNHHHHLHHLTASTATSSTTTTSGDDERDASEDDEDELLDDLDPLAGGGDETTVTTTNIMDDPLILESLSAEACQDMSALAAGYKLRDSRIIEIAGGRELYSASRSKAARGGGGGNSAGGAGKPKPGVWELRARCPLRRQHVCTAPCTLVHFIRVEKLLFNLRKIQLGQITIYKMPSIN